MGEGCLGQIDESAFQIAAEEHFVIDDEGFADDGFVGARFSNSLGDKWNWVLRTNVGAGGSDLALGVDLDFRRVLANGNQFTLGFRALDVDFSDSSAAVPLELETTFAGLTIGYTFNL